MHLSTICRVVCSYVDYIGKHRHPNMPAKRTASIRKYIYPKSTLGKPKITAAATSEQHKYCIQAMPAKQKLSSHA